MSGIQNPTPVNAAARLGADPTNAAQNPSASDQMPAAVTGAPVPVNNSAVGSVSNSDDLSNIPGIPSPAAAPKSDIVEPAPVLGEHDAAPQAGAPPNQPIAAQVPVTSLDLPTAPAALPSDMRPLATELPTPKPQPDLSAGSQPDTATRQTSTRAVPRTTSTSLTGKALGDEIAGLPQILSPADNIAADPPKGDSPTAGKLPSRSAEKAAAATGADPLGTASSGSANTPVAVVPGSTLLSSGVNAPAAASTPAATPSPATHGQPAASAPDLVATTQPRSADASEPAQPLSKVDVARLVRSVSGSELRVGVRSEEFGAVTIHAALGREQLSAHIATENERLGSALSAHLSSMQDTLDDRLGKGITLKTTVSVSSESSAGGSSANRDSAGHQSSTPQGSSTSGGNSSGRQHRYDPFTSTDSVSVAARPATSIIPSLQHPLDRLSIRI